MTEADAVALVGGRRIGGDAPETWADLGCGDGTFTRALATLLPARSVIHAMDRDASALRHIPGEHAGVSIVTHAGDFAAPPWPFGALMERINEIEVSNTIAQQGYWGRSVGTARVRYRTYTPLDGVLLANSLHYVRDQGAFIRACAPAMNHPRRFLIVEYDTDQANRWVPYPLSRTSLLRLFNDAGYSSIAVLGSRRSRYQRAGMYSALAEEA